MTRRSWLRSAALITAGAAMIVLAANPPAYSKNKKKAVPTPTDTPTPTATATPEQKVWNFDSDKAHEMAAGWKALEGDWQVIPDPTAPSQPNTFGLPPGRTISSLTHALEYYPMALLNDGTEYGDFTLESSFKSAGGRFDCSGGMLFRYVDANNYYLLSAGCPSDFFAFSRVTAGKVDILKQQVTPVDKGVWYKLKVVAAGGHFMFYSDDKMIFDFDDNKFAKGKIGLWARDDSQAQFDNVTITLPLPGAAPAAESSSGSSLPPMH